MNRILFLSMGSDYTYDCDVNFLEPLKKLCQVVNYNFFRRVGEIGPVAMNREVMSLVESERPECVFFHTFRHEVSKSTLKRITERGIPTVLWFSDDHWRFDDYSRYFGTSISYSVTTDHEAVDKYKALGLPVILSQWASNPDYYRPVEVEKDIDVSFVGGRMAPREALVEGLRKHGIRVEAFGSGWPNGRIQFDEMIRVFSRSRINLNSSQYWRGEGFPQIKGRTFEIPMSGGLLLTDYAHGLEDYFDIGKEILCFRSIAEAAETIKYYLAHDAEREQIARAGYVRSLRDHTWERRLRDLFEEVERREALKNAALPGRVMKTPPPPEELPLAPPSPRVLDTFASKDGRIVFRSAVATRPVSISSVDLLEGLVHAVPKEQGSEESVTDASRPATPFAAASQDLIFTTGTIDWLQADQVTAYLQECARLLAPSGLLLGMAKLWYAVDQQSVVQHRHRGYAAAHATSRIEADLRKLFAGVRVVHMHRPLGPLGPFVIFVASHDESRLSEPDVAAVLRKMHAAADQFARSEFETYLMWSTAFHSRGLRAPAIDFAWKAIRRRSSALSAWQALARAAAGPALWHHLRSVVPSRVRQDASEHPPQLMEPRRG